MERSDIFVLSMVVVVAVVGLATVFLQGSRGASVGVPGDEENIAGQASFKYIPKQSPGRPLPGPAPEKIDICPDSGKCGLVSLEALNRAEIIGTEPGEGAVTVSCDDMCARRGGKTCIGAYLDRGYSSGAHLWEERWAPTSCDQRTGYPLTCRCY